MLELQCQANAGWGVGLTGWIKWLLSWKPGFWLLGLIRRGNAPSPPPGSWENILTLKKSWDMLTAEKKQSSPGLVVAATSPAGTRITNTRMQRPRNQMVCAPETVWGKSQRTHHLLWLWGTLSSRSVPQNTVSTLDG